MEQFNIGTFIFSIDSVKLENGLYEAELTEICKNVGSENLEGRCTALGKSEKLAIENLKNEINELFFIKKEDVTPKDVIISLLRWAIGSKKLLKAIPRVIIIFCLFFIISIFFIDYKAGALSTVNENIDYFLNKKMNKLEQVETGFMTEAFFKKELTQTDSIFWASNVSFRTFQDRNKAHLEKYLKKKQEFKLVMLDPYSIMGKDEFMLKFSRTSRNVDLQKTIESLTNTTNGSLTLHGDISKHQVFLSDYSPVIPMIRVDDSILVSFPIHTDKNLQLNNYDGPYLKFHIQSKMGKLLIQHFNNMITTEGTRLIYPGVL